MVDPFRTPPEFATVTPYITVADAPALCRFLVEGLGAVEIGRHMDNGRIANAMFKLGNCTIMVGEARGEWGAMPANYCLYVTDADAAMAKALAAGGELLAETADQPYGDRQGGVRDPQGNNWWISQRLFDTPYY